MRGAISEQGFADLSLPQTVLSCCLNGPHFLPLTDDNSHIRYHT